MGFLSQNCRIEPSSPISSHLVVTLAVEVNDQLSGKLFGGLVHEYILHRKSGCLP